MLGFGDSLPPPGNGFSRVSVGVDPAAAENVSASRNGGLLKPSWRKPMNTGKKLKYSPKPARITVLLLANGRYAKPIRGPQLFLSVWNKLVCPMSFPSTI